MTALNAVAAPATPVSDTLVLDTALVLDIHLRQEAEADAYYGLPLCWIRLCWSRLQHNKLETFEDAL